MSFPGHITTHDSTSSHDRVKKKSVLTVISDQAVTQQVENFLESHDIDQFVVDLSIAEDLDSLVDEASWQAKFDKLKVIIGNGLTAAILVHPSMTFDSAHRDVLSDPYGKRHLQQHAVNNVRLETCLALRFLQLVMFFEQYVRALGNTITQHGSEHELGRPAGFRRGVQEECEGTLDRRGVGYPLDGFAHVIFAATVSHSVGSVTSIGTFSNLSPSRVPTRKT